MVSVHDNLKYLKHISEGRDEIGCEPLALKVVMRCKRSSLLVHLKVLLNIVTRVTQGCHPLLEVVVGRPR